MVEGLIITSSDYSDRLIFLPPVNFNLLPKLEQKANNWLTSYLRGLPWENGDYLYINWNQIPQSFVLRNHLPFFTLMEKKTECSADYLDRKVENLDDLGCPRVECLYFKNYPSCQRYIYTSLKLQESLHSEEKQDFLWFVEK